MPPILPSSLQNRENIADIFTALWILCMSFEVCNREWCRQIQTNDDIDITLQCDIRHQPLHQMIEIKHRDFLFHVLFIHIEFADHIIIRTKEHGIGMFINLLRINLVGDQISFHIMKIDIGHNVFDHRCEVGKDLNANAFNLFDVFEDTPVDEDIINEFKSRKV